MTLQEAEDSAKAKGGHVVCIHRMGGYEYGVASGPDPRKWPEIGAKVKKGEK